MMRLINIGIILTVGAVAYGLTMMLDDQYFGVAGYKKEPAIETQLGEPVPAFEFTDFKGRPYKISDFKDKLVVLNFWATWCPPCVVEMPIFIDLAKEYPDDVVVLAISSDFDEEKLSTFLEKLGKKHPHADLSNFKIFLDKNSRITRDLFQTYRLPETILIDRNQNMRNKLVGAKWKPEELREKLGALGLKE